MHLQQKEKQWMYVNAVWITFGTTKHRPAPNVKHSLRLWLGPCRQTIAFVISIIMKILTAPTMHAHYAHQIPTSMHLQQKEEQWMYVNAVWITFGTAKHRLAPNVKHSLRLWLGPCRQAIAFVI
jgi:hypothetical protein